MSTPKSTPAIAKTVKKAKASAPPKAQVSAKASKPVAAKKAKPSAGKSGPASAEPQVKSANSASGKKAVAKAKGTAQNMSASKSKTAPAKTTGKKVAPEKTSSPKPASKTKGQATFKATSKTKLAQKVAKSEATAPKAKPKATKSQSARSKSSVGKAAAPVTAPKAKKGAAAARIEVTEPVKEPELDVVTPEPTAMVWPENPVPEAGPTASGALHYDSHMHTPLCKHAWGEPEEYAAQGIQSGLKGIIFTCHCPMPDGFWPSVRMADSEFDTYLAIVERCASAYRGSLDVRLGLESEFFPGMEPWIEKLHQRANFDYILGAVHWQGRDYLARYETGTIEAFRKTYFKHLAESAESGLYDCLAHPDLVKNYHPDSWCFAIVKNQVADALDRIAATGVAMELNTSGLNKSYSEMNPGLEMLRMMADRKIPMVIASDSHRPHRVGEHFMTALGQLQEAGYEEVSYFLNRKRIDLKIAAVQASIKRAADAQVA